MLKIQKPISRNPETGDINYEDYEVLNPGMRASSGSEFEDYENLNRIPGDVNIYRVRGGLWYDGINTENWYVHVWDKANGVYIQQNFTRVDQVGRDYDLYVELEKSSAIPDAFDTEVVTLDGDPLTLDGSAMEAR